MKQTLDIRFIGMETSEAVEAAARRKADKLDRFRPDIMAGVPFEHLAIGDQVQFMPEIAAEGRQAKRVSVGKHCVG